MATFQPLTSQQYQQARTAGFDSDKILDMEKIRKAEFKVEAPKKSFGRKVAEFILPTTTGLLTGEKKPTARTVLGAGLEVGSFFVPASGIAKGIGLAGKGALTLGRKAALGAATGAASVGTYEAGRAIGEEETGIGDIAQRTARGLAFGGAFGGLLPPAIAGAKAIPGLARKIPKAAESLVRGAGVAKRAVQAGGRAIKGLSEEAAITVGKRIPEKITRFTQQRAEKAAYLKGQPAHVQEAVSKNIDQPMIEFIKKAPAKDKIDRVKMLEIAKEGTTNLSFQGQAKQIPGQTIVQGPISHLIKVKNIGVAQTDKVLSQLGTKSQNASSIYNQFVQDMANAGAEVSKGKIVPLRGSKIPNNDLKFYQEILKEILPNKAGQVPLTFRQMHQLRQKWFDVAKADKTFTGGPVSYARRLRSLLAQSIDTASKGQYLKAQNTTREALEGLQEYVRLTGYKGKLEDIASKDLKAGEVFLRIFGNASDRPTSVLDKVYSTARKYGYKGKENIADQLRFADILEDIYGSPTRALRGQVGRGISDTTDPLSRGLSAWREAVKWSPISAALRLTRGFLSSTPDDTLRAFENLIRAEAGQKIPTAFGGKSAKTAGTVLQQIKESASPLVKEVQEAIKIKPGFTSPKKAPGAVETPGKTAAKIPPKIAPELQPLAQEARKFIETKNYLKSGAFKLDDGIGGTATISKIKNGIADFIDIRNRGKTKGLFEDTLNYLVKNKGVKQIEIKMQSQDTEAILKRFVDKGLLENPRLPIGGRPTTFDISTKFYNQSVGGVKKSNLGKKPPVQAFGATAGIEPKKDEKGNVIGVGFNPTKAVMGIALISAITRGKGAKLSKEMPSNKSVWEMVYGKQGPPTDAIDKILTGQTKMRPPVGLKTDWRETLGDWYYMRAFKKDPLLSSPDEIAQGLGMTENELLEELSNRVSKKYEEKSQRAAAGILTRADQWRLKQQGKISNFGIKK